MLIKHYNFEGKRKDTVGWNLIEFIINDLETSLFDEVPKQNILIQKLRNAGWDEKVKIGEHCNHSIDGVLDGVGICGYFGHSKAAFQKLLPLQSLYEDRKIREGYFITQSSKTAELRHQMVNPNARPGTNGNRITFDDIVSAMGYYHRFITIPITIIGVEISSKNLQD